MYIAIILGIIILGIVYLLVRKNNNSKQAKRILDLKLKNLKELKASLFTSNHLLEMYNIHKRIFMHFEKYYIPACINVSEYGYFRAHSWKELYPDNIFLGNIFGLNTWELSYWVNCEDVEVKSQIKEQYKSVLLAGLNSIETRLNKDIQALKIYF
nr:MAG TPA: hypothetical protein [Bacteriophage sp.]